MKPSTIIYLAVSVLLIIGGVLLCMFASAQAKSQDVALFDNMQSEDGSFRKTYSFISGSVDQITLNLAGADVHVYGGAEESYIELVNFREGMFAYTVSSKSISLSQTDNLLSTLDIWNRILNFRGLRQYFRWQAADLGERAVNIYLTDQDKVKLFDFTVAKGDVLVQRMNSDSDYRFTVDSGQITLESVATTSTLTVNGKTTDIKLDGCIANTCAVNTADGAISALSVTAQEMTLNTQNGDISVELPTTSILVYAIDAAVGQGEIIVDGNVLSESTFTNFSKDGRKITAKTQNGKISIESAMHDQPEDSSETETDTAA